MQSIVAANLALLLASQAEPKRAVHPNALRRQPVRTPVSVRRPTCCGAAFGKDEAPVEESLSGL